MGCAMAWAVSSNPLTTEGLFHSQINPRGICNGKVALGHVSLRVIRFSPVSIIPTMLHTHLHWHAALTRGTYWRNLGTFHKATLYRKSLSIRWRNAFTFFSLRRVKQTNSAHIKRAYGKYWTCRRKPRLFDAIRTATHSYCCRVWGISDGAIESNPRREALVFQLMYFHRAVWTHAMRWPIPRPRHPTNSLNIIRVLRNYQLRQSSGPRIF
jgi:hypothetical protein